MSKEVIYRKLSELKKLPNNPRTIKKDDMERLKKSIKDGTPEDVAKVPASYTGRFLRKKLQ